MTKLENFFSLPDVDSLEQEVFISDRLGNVKIKPMTEPQFSGYQKRSQNPKDPNAPTDASKLNRLIMKNHVIEPNFCNADFLDKVGFSGDPDGFINKKILPGEQAEMVKQITALSGFEIPGVSQEMIDEVKN